MDKILVPFMGDAGGVYQVIQYELSVVSLEIVSYDDSVFMYHSGSLSFNGREV